MKVAMEVCMTEFNKVIGQIEHIKKASTIIWNTAMTTIKTLQILLSHHQVKQYVCIHVVRNYPTFVLFHTFGHEYNFTFMHKVCIGCKRQPTNSKKCTLRVNYSSFMYVCVVCTHWGNNMTSSTLGCPSSSENPVIFMLPHQ